MWHTYIVKCADGTLYTGITTDVDRRVDEHNTSPKSAKYTRSRRPVELVYSQGIGDKATASREEARIKKLSRAKKLELINNLFP